MGYSGSRASFYRLVAMWKHRDRNTDRSSSTASDQGSQELAVAAPEPINLETGHLISPTTAAALLHQAQRHIEPPTGGEGRRAESRL